MPKSLKQVANEFPDFQDRIEELRSKHYQFAILVEDFNRLTAAIGNPEQESQQAPSTRLAYLNAARLRVRSQVSKILHSLSPCAPCVP